MRFMGFLKKPTPLWVILLVVVSLSIMVLYFAFPHQRYREFHKEAFSTQLNYESREIYITDSTRGHTFSISAGYVGNITEWNSYDPHEETFWNASAMLRNETYHMNYSIQMNGTAIQGTYSVMLKLQNASKIFTFTVTDEEQLPKIFDVQWNTEQSPTDDLYVGIAHHSGWSRTPSFDRLLYLFILFLPEYFAVGISAITLLIVFLAYLLIRRRKSRNPSLNT